MLTYTSVTDLLKEPCQTTGYCFTASSLNCRYHCPRNVVQRSTCYRKACLSVCLSVSRFVTLVSHAYTVEGIEIHFKPYDRGMFLVS